MASGKPGAVQSFVDSWREMEPAFEDTKSLRPAAFLSRDVMAPSFARTGLSEAGRDALDALLQVDSVNSPKGKQIAEGLSGADIKLAIEEIVTHLREQDFSKSPGGIHGAIILAGISSEAHAELTAFISTLNIVKMHKGTKYLLENAKIIDGGH